MTVLGNQISRERVMERNFLQQDSVNYAWGYYSDEILVSDSTGIDTPLTIEKSISGDTVFILAGSGADSTSKSKLYDSAVDSSTLGMLTDSASIGSWTVIYP